MTWWWIFADDEYVVCMANG